MIKINLWIALQMITLKKRPVTGAVLVNYIKTLLLTKL